MIKSLLSDRIIRGYSFEYITRIVLRRDNKNNFIFLTSRFEGINEIIKKYGMCIKNQELIKFLEENWRKCDVIEFCLNNKQDRFVEKMKFYEVKTRMKDKKAIFFDTCVSNFNFMNKIKEEFNHETYLISITIFEDWRFSFNVFDYFKSNLRTYDSIRKKTVDYHRNWRKN